MSAAGVLRRGEGDRLIFRCPGCEDMHAVPIGDGPGPRWSWNRDIEKPTFKPSIRLSGVDLTEKGLADMDSWFAAGKPDRVPERFESKPSLCHSFVTDGNIEFLNDCTHALVGKTVPLPAIADEDIG